MNGKQGGIQPHRREAYKGQTRYQKRVAFVAEKLASIGDWLSPEKHAERRRDRKIECQRESRKKKRLWG